MFKLHLTSELKEAFISLTAKQMEGYRSGHAAAALTPPLKQMVLHEKRCTGCGACAVMCPAHAISVSDNKKHRTVTVSLSSCIYCGACAAICPEQALEFEAGSELPALAKDKLYHELKIRLKGCEHCQTTIGTLKGIAQTVKKIYAPRGIAQGELAWMTLCTRCRRTFHSRSLTRRHA
jgi:formate hydrogenlyase subunit 6/NADH:ubiquinone oxidoreductase subunit I